MDLLCIRIAFAAACLIAATGVEASDHWAYQPVTRPSVPSVDNFSWASGEMDCFILAKLRENGMRPARRANRRVLIRRVTLDLTGLPPASGEVDRFVVDDSPGAYRRVVERLLASPRFGERWGRHWLDVTRYGEDDTRGLAPGGGGRERSCRNERRAELGLAHRLGTAPPFRARRALLSTTRRQSHRARIRPRTDVRRHRGAERRHAAPRQTAHRAERSGAM